MRSHKRLLVGLSIVVLAMLALLMGCTGRQVKILVVAPFSGEQAKGAQQLFEGAQLAVDEWNAKGGVLGKPVVLVKADDKADPDEALKLAKEWGRKVTVIVGNYNSQCTLAAEDQYNKDRVLVVTPSSTNPDVTDRGYLTIFRVCGRDDQQGKSAAKYVADHFPGAKVAVLHDKSSYGQDLANEFLKNYEFITKNQAAFYGSIDRSQSSFTEVITKVKAAEPAVVYFGGIWPQGAQLVKDIRAAGLNWTFISGDGCYEPEFLRLAGPAGNGVLVTFIPNQENLPTAKATVEAYKRKFGEVGPYSLYSYTAVQVALEGIAKTGTTDAIDVARALHKMEINTPFGAMKFDEKGDPQQSPYVIWKVDNGKYVEVPMDAPAAPAPAAPAAPAPAK